MTNVFGIGQDILIAGFNEWGKDHDKTLEKVLQVCRQANVKDKCLTWCTSIPFFDGTVSLQGASPDTKKIQILTDIPPSKLKKELQSFLGILNYLSMFSPLAAEV